MVFGGDERTKQKRKGPCQWCGERESTQWRIGPSHAQTLCNACGVHWGRKKKLPQHRVPQGQARLKRERPAFQETEDSSSSDESKAAETLIELSLQSSPRSQKRRHPAAAGGRSAASEASEEQMPRDHHQHSDGNGCIGDTDASEAEVDAATASERRDEMGDFEAQRGAGPETLATSAAAQVAIAPDAMAARHAGGPSPSVASAAPVSDAEQTAVISMHPSTVDAIFANAFFMIPSAFDVFRVDWNSAHPLSAWSDARRAWELLPPDVVYMYQRRANAALLAPPSCPVEPLGTQQLLACSSPEMSPSQAPLVGNIMRAQQAAACLAN